MSTQQELKAIGDSHVETYQFQKAIESYTLAIEKNAFCDEAAPILSNRSLCYHTLGNYKEAYEDASRCCRIRPDWAKGFARRGAAAEKLGEWRIALESIDEYLKLDPKDEAGVKKTRKAAAKAVADLKKKEEERQEQQQQQLIQLALSNLRQAEYEKQQAYEELKSNYTKLKELKASLEVNIILQKSPSMTQDELKQIGNAFVKSQQYENAVTIYTLAIEKDAFCDGAASILCDRSFCYYNIGKYKEAYEDAGCCCGIKPAWAKGFARRGFAAEKLKEWKIALESYDEYLKLDKNDVMSVKLNKAAVEKVIKSIEREAKELKDRLCDMERTIVNANESKGVKATTTSRVFAVLLDACRNISDLSIEMIELALTHGGDLSMPFLIGPGPSSPGEAAKGAELLKRNAYDPSACCPAVVALQFLHRNSADSKRSDFNNTTLLVKQRNFLDRLLDVIDKQRKVYVPHKGLPIELFPICSFDATSPIRKDFVLILLEKGKKFFIGEKESDRDWRRMLLSAVLGGVATSCLPRRQNEDEDTFLIRQLATASPAVDRSIYECVQLLIEGLTAHDLNNIPKCVSLGQLEPNEFHLDLLPLQHAVVLGHRPAILQLLINGGAIANEDILFADEDPRVNLFKADGCKDERHAQTCETMLWCQDMFRKNENRLRAARGERRVRRDILRTTLEQNNPANASVLLKNGALLEVKDMPKWAIDTIHAEQKEYPNFSIMDVSEKQSTIFQSIITLKNSAVKTMTTASEETLRLLFDALADQNLSVYWAYSSCSCCDASMCHTPFTRALSDRFPVDFLRTLIKIRPKLIHSPMFEKDHQTDGQRLVIYSFGQLVDVCVEHFATVSLKWIVDVAKFLFEQGDLNYHTTIAQRENRQSISLHGFLEEADKDPSAGKLGSMRKSTAEAYLKRKMEKSSNKQQASRLLGELHRYCEDFERTRGNIGGSVE